MAMFRPVLMRRLVTSSTRRPLVASICQGRVLANRRPLDVDDDSIETISLREAEGSQEYGDERAVGDQTFKSRDSLHSQPKTDGPSERSINQVTLLGRVGTDPQIRGSEERPVTSFSLATNSVWKTANPGPGDSVWSHRVDWHNVVVFKPGLRESAYNNVHKGARLHITGRLLYGEVVDRAGVRRTTTTIACEDIIYLTRKM